MTLEGYTDELRGLAVGASLCKHARVPLSRRVVLDTFRRAVTAANAKVSGTFSAQTLDAVSPDHRYAVRVIVTTRIA